MLFWGLDNALSDAKGKQISEYEVHIEAILLLRMSTLCHLGPDALSGAYMYE